MEVFIGVRKIMKSKTKYFVSKSQISEIFNSAKLGAVTNVVELSAGEFNSAYRVTANGVEFVLKIAPKDNAHTLTYEADIMAREVEFYRLIAEKTDVKTPKIFYYDDTLSIIPTKYFIMEMLDSRPLNTVKLSKLERHNVSKLIGEMVAKLHTVKGNGFGYEQNGLSSNWYLALRSMVENLINDCARLNKKCRKGAKLLGYIDKSKAILESVESVYTHYDIWDGNIFYKNIDGDIELTLIDTERGFWGDGIGDFVSIELLTALNKKKSVLGYNKLAEKPIKFSRDEMVRYYIMTAYLGLIVYTEKFARYKIWQFKYYINIALSKILLKQAFNGLKKLL